MKKQLFFLLLFFAGFTLHGQTGLFNLSYALPLAEADSLLRSNGFAYKDSEGESHRYFPVDNAMVEAVLIFVEPKSERLAGWFIKYKPENTEADDNFVMETLQELHGKKNIFDEDTQQLIWLLSTTRSVHVLYSGDNSLTVLYFDAKFADYFKLKGHPQGSSAPETPKPPE